MRRFAKQITQSGCRGRLSCCGARKNLRACAFLDFFDRCNVCQRKTCSARRSRGQATSLALPFSAAGSGRARPLRVGAPLRCWSRILLIHHFVVPLPSQGKATKLVAFINRPKKRAVLKMIATVPSVENLWTS